MKCKKRLLIRKIPTARRYQNKAANMSNTKHAKKYWSKNIRILSILLFIWFSCSFGTSILFKESLDHFMIGGFPLGFWFAQQGSIYIFVILIFIYVRQMNKLDKAFGFDEDQDSN